MIRDEFKFSDEQTKFHFESGESHYPSSFSLNCMDVQEIKYTREATGLTLC